MAAEAARNDRRFNRFMVCGVRFGSPIGAPVTYQISKPVVRVIRPFRPAAVWPEPAALRKRASPRGAAL
jgi:hypothetical protein